jgi:hypothetical protein
MAAPEGRGLSPMGGRWCRDRCGRGEHGVELSGELAVSIADEESEPVGVVAEVHE